MINMETKKIRRNEYMRKYMNKRYVTNKKHKQYQKKESVKRIKAMTILSRRHKQELQEIMRILK